MSAIRCAHGYPARLTGTGIGCPQCDSLTEARARRDKGMAAAQSHRGAEQDAHVIDRAIRHVAALGEVFSINEIRPLLPAVGPQVIGARFSALRRRGEITRVGYTQATHPESHGRVVATWRGTAASRRTA